MKIKCSRKNRNGGVLNYFLKLILVDFGHFQVIKNVIYTLGQQDIPQGSYIYLFFYDYHLSN